MALLDSLLAFALTLAVLATVVTLLLETLIRICGLKRAGQVKIISRLLKDSVPDAESRWQAVKAILENPFADNKMADKESEQKFVGWKANGIYAEVSLEHVLRRLTESSPAVELVEKTQAELKEELQNLASRYDELASALSANFKRRAQIWSIVIGIAFAIAMNIDGLRILGTYLPDSALRQSIIDKIEIPEASTIEATAAGLPTAKDANDEIDAINEKIGEIKSQLDRIDDLGLPIGPAYFPYCAPVRSAEMLGFSTDRACGADGGAAAWYDYPFWFLKVLVTGLLIGLGAPFWYDVARRLAAVRTVLGGKGSGEDQHRGSDAKGDSCERDTLIGRIASDARAAAATQVKQGG